MATLDVNTDKRTVYFDMNAGNFVVFDTDGDDLLVFSYFDGEEIESYSIEEFSGEGWATDFLEVDETVVESPEEVIEEVLSRVLSDMPPLDGFNRRDVRFAMKATDTSRTSNLPF